MILFSNEKSLILAIQQTTEFVFFVFFLSKQRHSLVFVWYCWSAPLKQKVQSLQCQTQLLDKNGAVSSNWSYVCNTMKHNISLEVTAASHFLL